MKNLNFYIITIVVNTFSLHMKYQTGVHGLDYAIHVHAGILKLKYFSLDRNLFV